MNSQFPDEHETHDPDEVDDLLSKELLRLNVNERTACQEEIHGVHCRSPVETPEMVSKALHNLTYELDYRIPPSEKQAYLLSQQLPNSYVQSKGFRMRFLRSSLFDIPQVARRMVQFLDLVLELYGEFALQRPVCLSDFSSNELRLLRLGRFQYLPFGDRVGRRILMAFPDEAWESFPPKAKVSTTMEETN